MLHAPFGVQATSCPVGSCNPHLACLSATGAAVVPHCLGRHGPCSAWTDSQPMFCTCSLPKLQSNGLASQTTSAAAQQLVSQFGQGTRCEWQQAFASTMTGVHPESTLFLVISVRCTPSYTPPSLLLQLSASLRRTRSSAATRTGRSASPSPTASTAAARRVRHVCKPTVHRHRQPLLRINGLHRHGHRVLLISASL